MTFVTKQFNFSLSEILLRIPPPQENFELTRVCAPALVSHR